MGQPGRRANREVKIFIRTTRQAGFAVGLAGLLAVLEWGRHLHLPGPTASVPLFPSLLTLVAIPLFVYLALKYINGTGISDAEALEAEGRAIADGGAVFFAAYFGAFEAFRFSLVQAPPLLLALGCFGALSSATVVGHLSAQLASRRLAARSRRQAGGQAMAT